MAFCTVSVCAIGCSGACLCWQVIMLDSEKPKPEGWDCGCACFRTAGKPEKRFPSVVKPDKRAKGGKIPFLRFKRIVKEYPQARHSICARELPITLLAQSFEKVFPNRILIPANSLNKKVNLSLKNKTFREIMISSGLTLKS